MNDFYILSTTKQEYERLNKLIDADEKNRVRGREHMRNKTDKVVNHRGPIKQKIQVKIIGVSSSAPEPQVDHINQFKFDNLNMTLEMKIQNIQLQIHNLQINLQKMEHELAVQQNRASINSK